ncbi:hypothetical protein [Neisseria meningitidis]|uniref:hypothetical protein n=1 Tax=Neisseria meningitidis TaxID=487 RepID=UPI0038612F20
MSISLIGLHITIAIILFFTTNFMGKKSSIFGYYQLSFSEENHSPAFNIFYRAFTPILFIVIFSWVVTSFEIPISLEKINHVVIYYFIIRLLSVFVFEKTHIVNWFNQLTIPILSITLSFIVYNKMILPKSFLLPSSQEVATTFWIALGGYIYNILNNESGHLKSYEERRVNYVKHMHKKFESYFGKIIDKIIKEDSYNNDDFLTDKKKALIYSVLIYENFNRGLVYRYFEKILFCTGRIKTSGIMQVTSAEYLSNEESIKKGGNILMEKYNEKYNESIDGNKTLYKSYYESRRESIKNYNPDAKYINEIESIYMMLGEIYPNAPDFMSPHFEGDCSEGE